MAGQTLEQLEKAAIEQALQQFDGNRTKAAKALGIAASTLYEKLKRYGLVAGKGAGEKSVRVAGEIPSGDSFSNEWRTPVA